MLRSSSDTLCSKFPGPLMQRIARSSASCFWAWVLWESMASGRGLRPTYDLWILARFLVGVVEGVFFPSLLFFPPQWFTKKGLSTANTLLILGNPLTVVFGSIVSGYLVAYF